MKQGIISKESTNCGDIKCPFHGGLKVRGRQFIGTIISSKMSRTSVVEWEWLRHIQKYERYEKRRTKINAHNPACIDAKDGDMVRIAECRPLSKSKNFVIIENMGAVRGFKEIMEGREEAKKKDKVKKEVEENEK